ncbi:hypothetical protein PINS_up012544 [Pythium insidiosum]|nr:hypothetical protein PINS_up012544 [Pythium insidiosum]
MRQFALRQQSLDDNRRLRRALQSQLKLARSLERLLRRCKTETELFPTLAEPKYRVSATPSESDDHDAFEELTRVVDLMRHERDAVFSDPLYLQDTGAVRDIQVCANPEGGTVVNVIDARNLPFEVRPTADAVWGYFATTGSSDGGSRKILEWTETTLKKHFCFLVSVQRYEADFRGRLIARRDMLSDGRIAIEWAAMIDPEIKSTSSPQETSGLVVQQKGWTLLKPVPSATGCPLTRIQSKHVAIPFVIEDAPNRRQKTGTLTNFVLQSVYTHLQTSRRVIENVLIDASLKRSGTAEMEKAPVLQDL